MTSLPGNPHESCVTDLDDQVDAWLAREGETDATMIAVALSANTQATLTLAYERRTANNIALLGQLTEWNLNVPWVEPLIKETIRRLGVDEGEEDQCPTAAAN